MQSVHYIVLWNKVSSVYGALESTAHALKFVELSYILLKTKEDNNFGTF